MEKVSSIKIAVIGIVATILSCVWVAGFMKVDFHDIILSGISVLGGFIGNEIRHQLTSNGASLSSSPTNGAPDAATNLRVEEK